MEKRIRERWLRRSGISARYRLQRLDDLTWGSETDAAVRKWLTKVIAGKVVAATADTAGIGLVLYGRPGHGKSTLANLLVQELLLTCPVRGVFPRGEFERRPVFVDRFTTLLDRQRMLFGVADQDMSPEELTALHITQGMDGSVPDWAISVLVVDDLGTEHGTGWTDARFGSLIRTRYDLGLPTIITTNLAPSDWEKPYGESVASFAHEAFVHLAIVNPQGDRRMLGRR